MKRSELLNFISVLLLSTISIQSCNSEKLIPATNQPELIILNLDEKVSSSVSPIEKTDNKDFTNPELSPSPVNNIPEATATPVNNTTTYIKTPVPISSISPIASSEPIKKIYAIPLSVNAGKITAYLTYSSYLIGKVLVNLQNINETPTRLKLLDQYGNSVLDSNTFKFNISGHIVSDFSKQGDQKIKKLQLFFTNGNRIEVDITDGFLSDGDFPTPIAPLPTPVKTPELPTNYPQTFISSPTPIPTLVPPPVPTPTSLPYVITLAGSGVSGAVDGVGSTAQFSQPQGVSVDSAGNVYVADTFNNHRIRKITPDGVVSTLAGYTQGYSDGTGVSAKFNAPIGIGVDSIGNVYVADENNSLIRKITPDGLVSTLAGSTYGYIDGVGTTAKFKNPYGLAIDSVGNVYVTDPLNHVIRKITPDGIVSTFAGNGVVGYVDGIGTSAQFSYPHGIAVDNIGNVYVTDNNNVIRKITPDGVVSTFAGNGVVGYVDGIGTNAQFTYPYGLAVDSSRNVYVADPSGEVIRKITPDGIVSTLAGIGGTFGQGGYVNGSVSIARFSQPHGVAIDSFGNVYVADLLNHVIRKIVQN